MSDSLRDQLLKAGFSESRPTSRERKRKQRHASSKSSAQRRGTARGGNKKQASSDGIDTAEQEKRKATKRQIKALIDEQAIKEYAGEHIWYYQVQSRIRQAFVTEDIRQRLVNGELVLTRLNGASYVIPKSTGDAILAINPDWVVFQQQHTTDDGDDDYADFPVPDDLQW